tara:strand:+ start:721 stop:915 length:195 start_codon:yes stop_codon:yes gene_type:complete
MNDWFLDMAISNLEIKLNLLKAIKETNTSNDIEDCDIVLNVFQNIQKGNQEIINSMEQFINSVN